MKNVERAPAPSGVPESPFPGLVALCGIITGLAGLVLAVLTVVWGNHLAGALFLLAAALVFGLMANAVFRA